MEQNNLKQKFKGLPADLQDAIFDIDNAAVIEAVAKKYGLNVERAGELADEVGLLMVGAIHPKNFISNLNRRLGTDPETTKKIAQEINEQIFLKVKESLRKIHGVEEESIKPPQQPAQTAKSPFEQKLEEKVFKPTERPLVKEVEEAKKENRYPSSEDPYREPSK